MSGDSGQSPQHGPNRDQRFDDVVADYLDAVDAGDAPDEEALIEQHPDLADSLKKFFLDHRRMGGILEVDSAEGSAAEVTKRFSPNSKTRAPHDMPTLGYNEVSAEVLGAEQVGDYLLLNKIAQGGMGVVYKARQISLNRIVAVKMIRDAEFASREEIQRFQVEAEAAAQLQHPGIVPIYQIGNAEGQRYFSMAYVEGQSLAQMIRDAPMHPRKAAIYVSSVAKAVHYAHEQGIIHRDIKPANVLVDRNDQPMVTDFGLAKQIAGNDELTMSGQILGTASYMPPEQAGGKTDQITAKSDVYSLGAMLYALLTQRPPFTGQNPMDVLLDVLSKEPETPSSLNVALSRDLETICMKCLEKEPTKRYATAEDLAADLDRFLAGEPIVARRISKIERGIRWCKRKPFYAATIVLTILLAVGSPIVYYLREVAPEGLQAPKIEKPSLIKTARERYSTPPHATSQMEEIYVSAANAMLQFNHENRAASLQLFEDTARLAEAALRDDPANIALKLALADCYVEIANDSIPSTYIARRGPEDQSQAIQGRQLLESAEKWLSEVGVAEGESFELQKRLSRVDREKSPFEQTLKEAVAKLEAGLRGDTETTSQNPQRLRPDQPIGLIRFDLNDWDFELIEPGVPFEEARRLCVLGQRDAAILAYAAAINRLQEQPTPLTGLSLRHCFADLQVLDFANSGAVKSITKPLWPTDAEGFYNAILGIRLAHTDPLATATDK